MKVSDLMSRDVAWVAPDATAFDAARLMWQHDCGFIPVAHPLTRQVIGVVTDRDVCMAGYTQGVSLREIPIGRLMSRTVVHCSPWDDVERVHAKLRDHQIHRLPVLDDHERLVGVISLNDLARHASRQKGRDSLPARAAVADTLGSVHAPRLAPAIAT